MTRTKIEWATHTWNPVTGCTKVSEGCRHCYAERQVERFGSRVHARELFPNGDGTWRDGNDLPFSRVAWHHDRLSQPRHWRKPRPVFVCSMSDLFHQDVPDEFICRVWHAMHTASQHTFMVLTKRPQRMLELCTLPEDMACAPSPNVWLGVSVENQATADERIPLLFETPAAALFVSYEPALGPVDLRPWMPYVMPPHDEIDEDPRVVGYPPEGAFTYNDKLRWVICGGESGPGARPMHPDWARSLRDQCQAAGVPFFFKQWGEWAPPWRAGEALAESQNCGEASDRKPFCPGCAVHRWADGSQSWRIGKKASGRELDGRTHDEFPEMRP